MEYLFSFETKGKRPCNASRAGNTVIISVKRLVGYTSFSINYKEEAFNDMDALKEDVIKTVTNYLTLPTGGS